MVRKADFLIGVEAMNVEVLAKELMVDAQEKQPAVVAEAKTATGFFESVFQITPECEIRVAVRNIVHVATYHHGVRTLLDMGEQMVNLPGTGGKPVLQLACNRRVGLLISQFVLINAH